ncbi:MAG: hypothetical protein KDI13_05440 [Alphaproteobacteria bacterium]|nr:hypothetical protein [Alphaproteobacteria bacterium]
MYVSTFAFRDKRGVVFLCRFFTAWFILAFLYFCYNLITLPNTFIAYVYVFPLFFAALLGVLLVFSKDDWFMTAEDAAAQRALEKQQGIEKPEYKPKSDMERLKIALPVAVLGIFCVYAVLASVSHTGELRETFYFESYLEKQGYKRCPQRDISAFLINNKKPKIGYCYTK